MIVGDGGREDGRERRGQGGRASGDRGRGGRTESEARGVTV